MESTSGRTDGDMKENTKTIRNMALAGISGTMAEYLKESGEMVKEMDLEKLSIQMELRKRDNGKTIKEWIRKNLMFLRKGKPVSRL